MEEIKYLEKPDWVSWKDVCDCIRAADTVNRNKGFHMRIAEVEPDDMKKDLKDGKCFIALCGDKVIGTTSYKIRDLRKWYRWGKVIYFSYDGVRPEYRGTDVYFGLKALKYKSAKETGIKVYQSHTAEQNKTIRKINLKNGFKEVLFRPNFNGSSYYSVTMVKWEHGCPYPDWFINIMFNLSKFVTKTFYTKNGKFRPSLRRFLDGKKEKI